MKALKGSLTRQREHKFDTIEKQQNFMNNLYHKLQMETLDDWLQTPKRKIILNGGHGLVCYYYSYDMKKLLSTIYPNYPWRFSSLKTKAVEYFKINENQLNFMNKLSQKFQLKSLDDWKTVSPYTITRNGGKELALYYSNNYERLLTSVYPQHNWRFSEQKKKFITHEERVQFMDNLFYELKLKILENWLKVSKRRISFRGGKDLLSYFSNDMEKLLPSIYPNYPWDFSKNYFYDQYYFKSKENQVKYMDELYSILNLKSLGDWQYSKKLIIKKRGGKRLLLNYSNNMRNLLPSIYPNYPWEFDNILRYHYDNEFLSSIENQKKFLNYLMEKFNLNSIDDWKKISRNKLLENGAQRLLAHYSNDMKKLLTSLYPHHNFSFSSEKIKFIPNLEYSKSYQRRLEFLFYLKCQYLIQQKKDWYRLPLFRDLLQSLETVFPNEKWNKQLFKQTKRGDQRILLKFVNDHFSNRFLILEEYHLPNLSTSPLEFDIFLPALNIAFEYQGIHHYEDVNGTFNQLELQKIRDKIKVDLSRENNIKLIPVPYWWDKTLSSLNLHRIF